MSSSRTSDNEYYDRRAETLDRENLLAGQWRNLRGITRLAYQSCPLYHRLFKERGLHPSDIRTLDEFRKKVPIINKQTLRQWMESENDYTGGIFPTGQMADNVCLSSGYTGTNTFLAFTNRFWSVFLQKVALRELWMGKIRASSKVLITPSTWHFYGMFQVAALRILGSRVYLHSGTQVPRFASTYLSLLKSAKPDYLMITPSFLFSVLAQMNLEQENWSDRVKFIQTAGEPLSSRARARIMNQLRGAEIYESGGSTDGLWGGGECWAHSGHHTWMDSNFLELTDFKSGEPLVNSSPQERGSIVSTSLYPEASIFLRFNTEDIGTIDTNHCKCGRTHPRVEIIDRKANLIEVGGHKVGIHELEECLEGDDDTASRLFTVHRKAKPSSRILLSVSVFPGERRNAIVQRVRDRIYSELGIELEVVGVNASELPFSPAKLVRVVNDENL